MQEAATDRIALADFGRDERERRPVGQGPGHADQRDEDGAEHGRAHDEGQPHAHGEHEVREEPRAPQRQALDLQVHE